MAAINTISRLKEGARLSEEALYRFAAGLASGTVTDAQAGAFAMAACLNGLGEGGRVALTRAMRDSGDVLHWDLPGPVLDKHSTGGVGDCVSIILAPALAACGAYVPMISGRGLGHTGGTLDKLEAIPGVSTALEEADLRAMVARIGCVIAGATERLAPADRRLYAIRDVTATVASIDLITASILSKKLAAGLEALVLDVKTGSGAVMASEQQARALARALAETANGAGCRTICLLTDMSQPLVPAAGNGLEIAECMAALAGGDADGRLVRLTAELGGELLALGGLSASVAEGAGAIRAALADGRAMERFARMIAALGGPADFCDRWQGMLPQAPVVRDVPSPRAGVISAIETRRLGHVVVRLGGGRLFDGAAINPAVGLSRIAPVGGRVARGDPLLRIHAADMASAETAAMKVQTAFVFGDAEVAASPLVLEKIAP